MGLSRGISTIIGIPTDYCTAPLLRLFEPGSLYAAATLGLRKPLHCYAETAGDSRAFYDTLAVRVPYWHRVLCCTQLPMAHSELSHTPPLPTQSRPHLPTLSD